MKKYILVIISLLLLIFSSSLYCSELDYNNIDYKQPKENFPLLAVQMIHFSGVSAVDNNCQIGTYTSFWDGDFLDDNDQICYDSGASNATGTNFNGAFGTSYGKDGSIGWRYSNDDYLKWDDSSAEDLISKTSGTVWIEFRVATTCPAGDIGIFYAPSDTTPADNYIRMHIESTPPGEVRAYYFAGGVNYRADSNDLITCDGSTWNTVGMSWRVHVDNDVAITIGDSWSTGTVEEDRTLVLFTGDIDYMLIGAVGGATKNIDINRVVSLPGWLTDCPWE